MKVLSVQQPMASLIVTGVKDVENRTWNTHFRGKFLIHASSRKVPEEHEEEFMGGCGHVVDNLVNTGNLPDLTQLPTGAILGVVDLTDDVTEFTGSIWDSGEGIHKFVLENARMFDAPITGVKGKLFFWDYPIDENSLPPSHTAQFRYYRVDGTTLIVPSSQAFYDTIIQRNPMCFEIWATQKVVEALTYVEDKQYIVKEIKTVRFELPDRTTHEFSLMGHPGFVKLKSYGKDSNLYPKKRKKIIPSRFLPCRQLNKNCVIAIDLAAEL